MKITTSHRILLNLPAETENSKWNPEILHKTYQIPISESIRELKIIDPNRLDRLRSKYSRRLSPLDLPSIEGIKPKDEQCDVLDSVLKWKENGFPNQVFHIYGLAGTGKSTLAAIAQHELQISSLWVAPTGKAAQNLRIKGLSASTIHSACYTCDQDMDTGSVDYRLRPSLDASLIACDESLMVGNDVGSDLLSFGLPILAIGDPGQLPPIEGESPFFTRKPEGMLTTINRNALNSPIVQFAHRIRNKQGYSTGKLQNESGSVHIISNRKLNRNLDEYILQHTEQDSTILCGTNRTRNAINKRARELLGFEGRPRPDELLICLKNKLPFVNGGLWRVLGSGKPRVVECTYKRRRGDYIQTITSMWTDRDGVSKNLENSPVTCEIIDLWLISADIPDQDPIHVQVPNACFTGDIEKLHWKQTVPFTQFAYGYCLTTHKAQGSEFKRVLCIDESHVFREQQIKHRYTSATRCKESLTFVLP